MKFKYLVQILMGGWILIFLASPVKSHGSRRSYYPLGSRGGYASAHDYQTARAFYSRQWSRYGGMVAASRYLPCGSRVKVFDVRTRRYVEVTIIDWGPNRRLSNRIIDLSQEAYRRLFRLRRGARCGVQRVTVVVVFRASGRNDPHIHRYRGTRYLSGVVS